MNTPYPPFYFLPSRMGIGFADLPWRNSFFILSLFFLMALMPADSLFGQGKTTSDNVHALAALSLNLTSTNPTCAQIIQPTSFSHIGNGSVMALVSGGTPPYTYSISPGIYQNNGYFPALDVGNYTVVVKDALGATASRNAYLSATLPQPLMSTHILQIPGSCTSADGSLELIPYGGTPPYTYSADGGLTFSPTANLQTNLQQGYFYVFLMKDANGCVAASNTSVEPSTPNYFMCTFCCPALVEGAIVQVPCSADGILQVNMMGGTPPFQFSLDGINYLPSNNPNPDWNTFSNLSPGLYHVYAKDATGSVSQASFTLARLCATALSFQSTDPLCNQSNGIITVTPQFGTPPYSYTLDGINFQPGNFFGSLSAGNYNILVRDAAGEQATAVATLTEICPVVTAVTTDEACGQHNGTITAQGSKGTAPYAFSIDGINFQSGNIFTGLAGGNYTVTVKDLNGLTGNTSVVILTNNCLQITTTPVNTSCGNLNGSITVSVGNGTAPYQYSLDGTSFSTSNTFNALAAGAYLITVKDAAGLNGNSQVILIDLPGAQISDVSVPPFCSYSTGTMTISAAGGASPLQYSADGGNNFQSSNIFTDIPAGQYSLQVKDANGCLASAAPVVTAITAPVVFLGNDTSICTGDKLNLFAPSSAGYQYQWQDNSTDDHFTVSAAGIYSVKVTDVSNCAAMDNITVSYMDKPVVDLGKDTGMCNTRQLALNAFSPGSSYLWQDGSTEPGYTVSEAGTYSVQVTNVCGTNSAALNVKYENCTCHFYVPNAFTPNNDGKNDLFAPKYTCLFDHYLLKIFNRWGQLVYTTADPGAGWNGNLGGVQQPEGTYIWDLEYHDLLTDKLLNEKGTVVLIR